jgi:hypothetical protein
LDGTEDGMISILLLAIFSFVVFEYAHSWRRLVAVTVLAAITAGMIFPQPAAAQFGILGGIRNIINIINGAVRSGLNAINSATGALRNIHEQIVWPTSLINRRPDYDRLDNYRL